MTKPTFTASISLGNVLTLLALMIAGVTAFIRVEGTSTSNRDAIAALAETVARHETRLRVSEVEAARSEERLSAIYSILARIDSRLERIERRENDRRGSP